MSVEDWLNASEHVVNLIGKLVWPGVVIFVILRFQDEIKDIIKKIKEISFGDLNLSVNERKQEQVKQQEGNPDKEKLTQLYEFVKSPEFQERFGHALQEYTAKNKETFQIGYHFEKTYRLIFGSQLSILSLLTSSVKLPRFNAGEIYRKTVWRSHGYTFNQYIGFLVSSGLIAYNATNDMYSLTPLGGAFMDYLVNNNIPLNKQPY
jgi:hypothetical protein